MRTTWFSKVGISEILGSFLVKEAFLSPADWRLTKVLGVREEESGDGSVDARLERASCVVTVDTVDGHCRVRYRRRVKERVKGRE